MGGERLIIVGYEVSDQLRGWIDGCSDRDRVYLNDPEFLEEVSIDGKPFIGKRCKNGIAIDRIEDMARSVVSLLSRIHPDAALSTADALVIAAEETESAVAPPEEPADDDFEYSDLVE